MNIYPSISQAAIVLVQIFHFFKKRFIMWKRLYFSSCGDLISCRDRLKVF